MKKFALVAVASLAVLVTACKTTTTTTTQESTTQQTTAATTAATTVATTVATTESAALKLQQAVDALDLGFTEVNANVTLPTTGINGSSIFWISNKPEYLTNTGVYTKPSTTTQVKLIAVITIGSESTTTDIILNVIGMTVDERLADAKEALTLSFTEVTAKVTLPTTGKHSSKLTWVSDNTAVLANDGTYTAPVSDVTVKLTATITIEGKSVTKEFTVTVKPAPQTEPATQSTQE